jgi:hypothetical protein
MPMTEGVFYTLSDWQRAALSRLLCCLTGHAHTVTRGFSGSVSPCRVLKTEPVLSVPGLAEDNDGSGSGGQPVYARP